MRTLQEKFQILPGVTSADVVSVVDIGVPERSSLIKAPLSIVLTYSKSPQTRPLAPALAHVATVDGVGLTGALCSPLPVRRSSITSLCSEKQSVSYFIEGREEKGLGGIST